MCMEFRILVGSVPIHQLLASNRGGYIYGADPYISGKTQNESCNAASKSKTTLGGHQCRKNRAAPKSVIELRVGVGWAGGRKALRWIGAWNTKG